MTTNKTNNWIYFGIFLPNSAKTKNIQTLQKYKVNIPQDWKVFNHHMTIAFNNGSEIANKLFQHYEKQITSQENVTITVNGIGISKDAIALRIDYNLPIANKIPHVTIATPIKGKPVNSNFITKWIDIEPYQIVGKFNVFNK